MVKESGKQVPLAHFFLSLLTIKSYIFKSRPETKHTPNFYFTVHSLCLSPLVGNKAWREIQIIGFVNMGAKGEMIRRLPYALSCFGGSSVPDEMKSSRRSARSSLSWSRSRAMKKTVPLDYEEDNDNAQEMKDIPSAKVTATKKGLFQRFHKDKSSKQLQNRRQATTSYKSPACHVTSKFDTQAQTVTLLQEPVLPAQMKIKIDRTGSPTKPAGTSPTVSKVQNKKKKRGGEIDVGVALIALAVTLVTMLSGGRCLAIAFTSIGFYTLPYLISATAMSSQRNRTHSVEMYPSLEQYSVKILIQDIASMSRKINRSILFG